MAYSLRVVLDHRPREGLCDSCKGRKLYIKNRATNERADISG